MSCYCYCYCYRYRYFYFIFNSLDFRHWVHSHGNTLDHPEMLSLFYINTNTCIPINKWIRSFWMWFSLLKKINCLSTAKSILFILQYSLVCDRAWLVSFMNTLYTFGTLVGSQLSGFLSDRYKIQIKDHAYLFYWSKT